LGLRGTRWRGTGENCTMRSLMICTLKLITYRVLRPNRMKRPGHMAIVGEVTNTYIQNFGRLIWRKEIILTSNL
jgi:hypothetical protein